MLFVAIVIEARTTDATLPTQPSNPARNPVEASWGGNTQLCRCQCDFGCSDSGCNSRSSGGRHHDTIPEELLEGSTMGESGLLKEETDDTTSPPTIAGNGGTTPPPMEDCVCHCHYHACCNSRSSGHGHH